MSPLSINDIQEEVVNGLQKELKMRREESSELRSLVLLLLHLHNDEITINQEDHKEFIKKMLSGSVGLLVQPDGDTVTLKVERIE